MSQLTIAQLLQKKERNMMKRGVFLFFFACPKLDVSESHREAIQSFLKSSTCEGKKTEGKNYPEVVSKNLYPERHSKITLLFVDGRIFLVHTEGTCLTHELQDKNPEYADEDIGVEPPRTIIIDISGDLSGKEISASVLSHELAHPKLHRFTYHIEVCISSGNLSQKISVLINLYQLGADENGSDGSVRKNIVIEQTGIVRSSVKSDGIVFLAELLNDDTTIERVDPGEEEEKVVGSIYFGPVLKSTNM